MSRSHDHGPDPRQNGNGGAKREESVIRDGLTDEEQAAVDEVMGQHTRVQAWPLHRSKVVYFVRCVHLWSGGMMCYALSFIS